VVIKTIRIIVPSIINKKRKIMKKKMYFLLISFMCCGFFTNAQDQTINGNLILGQYNSTTGRGNSIWIKGTVGDYGHPTFIERYANSSSKIDLRLGIGFANQGDRFVVGQNPNGNVSLWKSLFVVMDNGNVGIGGVESPTNKLDVNGTIRAKEVIVETGWADFVFKPDYELPSLSEVESHIKEKGHLPEIPSETEVLENGVSLGEMNVKLLQKIEEMTLYIIQQEKEIISLKKRMEQLEK
jgi:hypothetical protein